MLLAPCGYRVVAVLISHQGRGLKSILKDHSSLSVASKQPGRVRLSRAECRLLARAIMAC